MDTRRGRRDAAVAVLERMDREEVEHERAEQQDGRKPRVGECLLVALDQLDELALRLGAGRHPA